MTCFHLFYEFINVCVKCPASAFNGCHHDLVNLPDFFTFFIPSALRCYLICHYSHTLCRGFMFYLCSLHKCIYLCKLMSNMISISEDVLNIKTAGGHFIVRPLKFTVSDYSFGIFFLTFLK